MYLLHMLRCNYGYFSFYDQTLFNISKLRSNAEWTPESEEQTDEIYKTHINEYQETFINFHFTFRHST